MSEQLTEQLPALPEADPTAELINKLQDRLRQRAVDAGITHEPVLADLEAVEHVDDGGRIIATRQHFKIGTRDSSAPVEGVYNWLDVTVTTSEDPNSLGVESYAITDTATKGSAARQKGPARWSDGDTKITQRVVTSRGARVNDLTEAQISGLLEHADDEDAVVVDLAKSKIVESWKDGGNGFNYLVSQVVELEEPKE